MSTIEKYLNNMDVFLNNITNVRLGGCALAIDTPVTNTSMENVTRGPSLDPISHLALTTNVTHLHKSHPKNTSFEEKSKGQKTYNTEQNYFGLTIDNIRDNLNVQDWEDIKDDPDKLACGAKLLVEGKQIAQGLKPEDWDEIVTCVYCGPVFVSKERAAAPGTLGKQTCCPWCENRETAIPIPRSAGY